MTGVLFRHPVDLDHDADIGGVEPRINPRTITDIGAGMWSAFAIMAALRHREVGGEGQYIDISMLDAQVAWLTYQAAYFFAMGEAPKRLGAAHPTLVPYQGFMCQDGKRINVAVGSERIWERFCGAIKRGDLLENPDYSSNGGRVDNRFADLRRLSDWLH